MAPGLDARALDGAAAVIPGLMNKTQELVQATRLMNKTHEFVQATRLMNKTHEFVQATRSPWEVL